MSDGTSAKLRPASHTFVDVLRVIRAPLFFAIVAFLLFWLPGQSQEVYRILANEPFEHITEVVVSLAALTALTAVLWYNCVVALRWQKLIAPAESEAALNVKFRAVDLVSILPAAGVVAGFLADSSSETMPIYLILVLLLVGGLITVVLPRLSFAWWNGSGATSLRAHLALTVVLGLVCVPFFIPSDVSERLHADALANVLGPIGVICLFIAFAATLTCLLSHNYNRNGIPVLLFLAVCAVVLSRLDVSDGYQLASVAPKESAKLQKVSSAFTEWRAARELDIAQYTTAGRKYPVFIVTAEGGGITAAYHTAVALARIQETCPAFARHTFAISAVSGGSLGAAVFQASMRGPIRSGANDCLATSPSKGPIERASKEILSQDFLSPMVAAGLFPNIAQYWTPVAIPSWDRSRAFERSVSQAWTKVKGPEGNPFRGRFLDHWSPAHEGPALFLNTTHAETGQRLTIAPMHYYGDVSVPGGGFRNLISLGDRPGARAISEHDARPLRDFDLAAAVGISARFPWISSAGWLSINDEKGDKVKLHLVDGGYADNSGIETALDIYRAVRGTDAAKDVEFHFLIIFDDTHRPPSEFRELQGPIHALMAARKERGRQVMLRFWAELCAADTACRSPKDFFKVKSIVWQLLNDPYTRNIHPFPLGWRLSKGSREGIERRVGRVEDCKEADSWSGTKTGVSGCAIWHVRHILQVKAPLAQSR